MNEIYIFSLKQTSQFYLNNSELKHGLSKPNFSPEINVKKTITVKNSKASFTDKVKKVTFDLDKDNLFKTCKDNFLDCPWYFRCESNKYELIRIKKVCDFNFDCNDQSDEKHCSKTTHFNCTTGYPVSIDKKKVNDYQLDCSDLSDECEKNSISSAKQMIKNVYLRNYIWITFISIIFLNTIVFINTFKTLKNVKDKRSKK